MSAQVDIKIISTQENKAVPLTVKKSRIPVLKSRAPLRNVQCPPLRKDTPTTRAYTAVKTVPDFKLLHSQWAKKLAKAKERHRKVLTPLTSQQRRDHTPLTSQQRRAHTPLTSQQRRAHTPLISHQRRDHTPLTTKATPSQGTLTVRARAPALAHAQQVEAIFTRMALSTNNMIRKMSIMDRDRESPIRADLSEQLTAAQDSPPSHCSQTTLPTPSHTSPLTSRGHSGPPPSLDTDWMLPCLPFTSNFYEYEPELLYIRFTHGCPAVRESGRRNPLSVVLNSLDSECHFNAIK